MPFKTALSHVMDRAKRLGTGIGILLLASSSLYGWGSMDTGDAFGTHQFLNDKAYFKLKQHPAYNYAYFPTLRDIQRHSGVDLAQNGLGPDVQGNSRFSDHWYNPDNRQGDAPKTFKKLQSDLTEALVGLESHKADSLALETHAHLAAYSAHYIQDMTCPMHVSGMNPRNINLDIVGSPKDLSPFQPTYSKIAWQKLIDRYVKVMVELPEVNFFDPLYYDGNYAGRAGLFPNLSSQTGSHFQYELKVEAKYLALSGIATLTGNTFHDDAWEYEEKKGYIPASYRNGMDMADLAKQAAELTRQRIGTRDNPGPLWVDLEHIYDSLKIPYDDWWRAIQLTYVSWRSSFSALHTRMQDIQYVKISDDPVQYQLFARVINLEPKESGDATVNNVRIGYAIDYGGSGNGRIGTIPAETRSKWIPIGNTVSDLRDLRGKITLTLEGDYDAKIPDSGYKVVSYDLPKIAVDKFPVPGVTDTKKDLVKVPELVGFKKSWALQTLKTLDLKASPASAGPAPSQTLSEMVVTQSTKRDTFVPKGTSISFEAYAPYSAPTPPPTPDDPVDTTPPTPPTPPVDQNATTPPPSHSGGLVIAGPTELLSGEGASYTATDGAGVPYTTGSFSWVSSVEDVLVLGRSGNPVSGVGFKEGSSTVIAHYEGMTAYLDVTVKANKPNVVPDITGILAKDASAKITAAGLTPALTVGDAAPDKASEYTVYSQSPEVGKSVAPASAVTGIVYGKYVVPKSKVPGVLGLGANEARIRITESDLVAATVPGDTAPEASKANTVQSQSHGAGSEVDKFTTITLTLYGSYEKNERCQKNQSRYYAAYSADDYALCQKILADSSDCAFAAGEGSKLDQTECRSANSDYYSALSSKDYGRARSILLQHSECSFYNDHIQELKCSENLAAMQSALSANDVDTYKAILAQSSDCSYYASLAAGVRRAEQQAATQRQNNQQLATALGTILGGALQVALHNPEGTQNTSRGGNHGGGNPNRNAPPTVHQGSCNDVKKAGGNTPERHIIDLGRGGKSFMFDFDTYTVKDTVIVSQGGRVLFNSGCVGTKGVRTVKLKKGMFDSKVTVDVQPNCDNSNGTSWQFTVHCPMQK